MQERGQNKQLAINMSSSILVFALGLCVTFFLTPYIVGKLGTAAYGFIGLSNTIIGYTSIITVAVSSMAGRFISVSYHSGDIQKANIYMSSAFFTYLTVAVVSFIIFCFCTVFLQDLINIPVELVGDVKTLFFFLVLSSLLGMMTGVFSIGTFIKNRLDITNIRNLIASIARAILLLLIFGFLTPHLWYFGLISLITSIYYAWVNLHFCKVLTPELSISRRFFNFKHLIEIASTGIWNILNRLSVLLAQGLNLWLANLFISAYAMGIFSITQTIPGLLLSFTVIVSGNFAPEFTRLYALKDNDTLKKELIKAINLSGFFSVIPISIFFAYGDLFYGLWLPQEDMMFLYILSILGSVELITAMPLEPLWNIFTITKKIKQSSFNLFYNSVAIIGTVIIVFLIVKDNMIRIYALAGIRNIYGLIRTTTFLPMYGAKCLGYRRSTFFPYIIKNILNIGALTLISIAFKKYFLQMTWTSLFIGGIFTCIIGVILSWKILLNPSERNFILQKLHIKA